MGEKREKQKKNKKENECLFNSVVPYGVRKREHLQKLKLLLTSTSKSHIKSTFFLVKGTNEPFHHSVETYTELKTPNQHPVHH